VLNKAAYFNQVDLYLFKRLALKVPYSRLNMVMEELEDLKLENQLKEMVEDLEVLRSSGMPVTEVLSFGSQERRSHW